MRSMKDVPGWLRTQADGSVRAQRDCAGAAAQDPMLLQRISSAYERRMGR